MLHYSPTPAQAGSVFRLFGELRRAERSTRGRWSHAASLRLDRAIVAFESSFAAAVRGAA
jgi:hypothetical protein